MATTAAGVVPVTLLTASGTARPPCTLDREGEFIIGRGADCTVALDDESVSRRHARLEVRRDGLTIRDLDSVAGTWVNGVRIESDEETALHDRDLVGVGPWSFLVRFADGESDAAHVLPEPKPSDPYQTRPSIFLHLRADGTMERQLGWNDFNRLYAPVIAGFARNAGLKPQEVDDIVQDVMLGFFRVAESFEYDPRKGRFRGYLKRITLNSIRSRRRRKRPTQNVPDTMDPAAETSQLETAWDREWTEHLLRRALEEVRVGIQPKTMEAFELYGIKGMPASEVAKETGMTEAAIRHAKMRVLQQLRDCIRRLRDEEG